VRRYEVSDGVMGIDVLCGDFPSEIAAAYAWARAYGGNHPALLGGYVLVNTCESDPQVYGVRVKGGKLALHPMKWVAE
jgi:hypothetical protein